MLRGIKASQGHTIIQQSRKLVEGQTVGCIWCRSINGRHQGPPHEWLDTYIDGNPICPEFESWIAFLRTYVPLKCEFILLMVNNAELDIEVHGSILDKVTTHLPY